MLKSGCVCTLLQCACRRIAENKFVGVLPQEIFKTPIQGL
jgi:hypothetical protein